MVSIILLSFDRLWSLRFWIEAANRLWNIYLICLLCVVLCLENCINSSKSMFTELSGGLSRCSACEKLQQNLLLDNNLFLILAFCFKALKLLIMFWISCCSLKKSLGSQKLLLKGLSDRCVSYWGSSLLVLFFYQTIEDGSFDSYGTFPLSLKLKE